MDDPGAFNWTSFFRVLRRRLGWLLEDFGKELNGSAPGARFGELDSTYAPIHRISTRGLGVSRLRLRDFLDNAIRDSFRA